MNDNNDHGDPVPDVPSDGFVVKSGLRVARGRKRKTLHFERIRDSKLGENVFAYIGVFHTLNQTKSDLSSDTENPT
jgi:hypothetical protein